MYTYLVAEETVQRVLGAAFHLGLLTGRHKSKKETDYLPNAFSIWFIFATSPDIITSITSNLIGLSYSP